MTDEQRFFFDRRGWILLPAVPSQREIDAARSECYAAGERGDHRRTFFRGVWQLGGNTTYSAENRTL